MGLAASFISALGGIIALALDGLTALFLFAGGVVRSLSRSLVSCAPIESITDMHGFSLKAFAARIPISCSCNQPHSDCTHLTHNNIVNGGVIGSNHDLSASVDRVGRCRQAQADTAFIWFAWAAFCASAFFSFLAWRRGGLK